MMGDLVMLLAMLGDVCRLAMAAVFLQAAAHAMQDWPAYEAVVQDYRLATRLMARLAAKAMPPAQIAAAILLLIPGAMHAGPALGLALMAMFTGAIAINLLRGRVFIDCGCGGAAGQHISMGLIIRNLTLCALLAVAWVSPLVLPPSAAFAVGVAGAGIFAAILYVAASQLLANAQALAA
jgi:hypothetical protein